MKNINRIIALIIGFAIAITMSSSMFNKKSYAASASVTIALSKSNVSLGDNVTVTVTYSASTGIGAWNFNLSYDSSILEYVSGADNGEGGVLTFANYSSAGSQQTVSYSVTFKAIASGTTKVTTKTNEIVADDESFSQYTVSEAGATITVGANEQLPSDATLSSLSISPGTLSPNFSSKTTSYSVNVGADVTKLIVSANPQDSQASVAISGNTDLQDGVNTVYVIVTAQSGTKKTYTISVNKGDGNTEETTEDSEDTSTEESSETENSTNGVEIGGKTLYFVNDANSIIVPSGFSVSSIFYNGQEELALLSPSGEVTVVCMLDDVGTQYWYIYIDSTGGFEPYVEYQSKNNRYVIITPPENVIAPEGFTEVDIDIKGITVRAFENQNEVYKDMYLVYALNIEGTSGFYIYDTVEETFQRFTGTDQTLLTNANDGNKINELIKKIKIAKIIILSLSIILLFIVIFILIIYRKRKAKLNIE